MAAARNVTKGGNKRIAPAKKWDRKKVAVTIAIATAALLLLAAALISIDRNELEETSVVATINGEAVTYREFKQSIDGHRAKIVGYFQSEYKAETGPKFWTTNYNGEVPLDKIKKDALAALTQIKIPQIMAKERGIVSDITYEAFLKNLEAENERRANAKKNNQVVFGPVHYDVTEYYGILYSNLVGDLKKAYQEETAFTEDELIAFYAANKELYRLQDSIKIVKASLSGADGEKILKDIRANIEKGMDVEAASEAYKEKVKVEEQVFDAKTAHSDTRAHPILASQVLPLKKGEVTEVFEENGSYILAQCVERADMGYLAFQDVKQAIRVHLAGIAYEEKVNELIGSADIVINDSVYDRIGVKEINEPL